MQTYLVSRADVAEQRFGWTFPAAAGLAGWLTLGLVKLGIGAAALAAYVIIGGCLWLFLRPGMVLALPGKAPAHNNLHHVMGRFIQQAILFFSLPFLVQATDPADKGQLLVTGFVVLAALLSLLDRFYRTVLAQNPIISLAFQSLCCFVVVLIVLPAVVDVPPELNFTVAIGCVLLWLVVAVPLNYRKNAISLRLFALALIFPLAVWNAQEHIPAADFAVRQGLLTSTVEASASPADSSVDLLFQLTRGFHIPANAALPDASARLSRQMAFFWQQHDHSQSMQVVP